MLPFPVRAALAGLRAAAVLFSGLRFELFKALFTHGLILRLIVFQLIQPVRFQRSSILRRFPVMRSNRPRKPLLRLFRHYCCLCCQSVFCASRNCCRSALCWRVKLCRFSSSCAMRVSNAFACSWNNKILEMNKKIICFSSLIQHVDFYTQ